MRRENKTRYAVLGLLSYGPMSGYEIKKATDNSIAHFWRENFGQIYPVLEGLRDESLVELVAEERDADLRSGFPGRARKRYRISDAGREELERWLSREAEQPGLRIELLLKLFFGKMAPKDVLIRHVESELRIHTEKLRQYEEIKRHMTEHRSGGKAGELGEFEHGEIDHLLWKTTLSYGEHYSRAVTAWCTETLAALKSMNA